MKFRLNCESLETRENPALFPEDPISAPPPPPPPPPADPVPPPAPTEPGDPGPEGPGY